ncbi:MAG: histidinol-phosphatase HisJ [Candidatus Omnitrophota bacterium]
MHDYHIHTSFCKHAEGEINDYIEAAIEKGITEICFTDHIPMPDNFDPNHRMFEKEFEQYVGKIEMARARYRHMPILIGIEAEYIEGYEEYLQRFLASYPFDIVIMAVHFIKKWTEKQWVFSYEYTDETIPHQYKDYFDSMLKGIQTKLFDVVGHLDLIKRLGHPVLTTNRPDVERVIQAASDAGMSLELNTSGLRKQINETYPTLEIIGMAAEKDIPIVFSSDAHKPEHVGDYFDDMLNELFQFPNLKLGQYRQRKCLSKKILQPINEF